MKKYHRIPFDDDGNMENCPTDHRGPWKEGRDFKAKFDIIAYHKGTSSVVIELEHRLKGTAYWLSLHEFMRLLLKYPIDKGRLPELWWEFRKRGHSYFIYEARIDAKLKEQIDLMPQVEMARHRRFSGIGHPLHQGATGDYFEKVFEEKGGMTPSVSHEIGWGAPE